MRKGFTLVEMLAVVISLPFLMIVLDGLFKTLIKDIPRSYQVVQANTSLMSMLKEMQQDIDKAKGLPKTYNQYTSGDTILLIDSPEGIISYQLKDDKMFKYNLTDNQPNNPEEQKVWSVPNAKVQWKVWRNNMSGYAVEVRTHITYKVNGHLKKKMANSHLYFVGAL
ncbi:MAG: prepilin-type N-terminal cleavage/methylation domain-containing protein [Sedimentisphaerales bacterium]|nr:prepilin-type N-terminal cleavage/methylation domain-containing protein [Sedimentisphaerales bacterium]